MPTLTYDDIHQHYEVYGSGEPFFLHHGLTSSCEMWHPHLPWLTRKYQVILMDARGHGMTTAPAGDDHYSWEIMAADVNRLLEAVVALVEPSLSENAIELEKRLGEVPAVCGSERWGLRACVCTAR